MKGGRYVCQESKCARPSHLKMPCGDLRSSVKKLESSEIRKREYYEKPSVKRKRKAIAAKKKAAKARMLLGV